MTALSPPPRTRPDRAARRRAAVRPASHASAAAPAAVASAVDPWRRMVLSFLGMFVGAIVTVAAVTAWIDPLGIVRGSAAHVVSEEPLYRTWKVDLLRNLHTPPQVLLLGSSTMRDLDPQAVQRIAHRSAFNASVAGGSPIDEYALAAYAAERFPGHFPHLVVGIDVDVTFRALDPSPALLRTPELARQFSATERASIMGSVFRPYLTWTTLQTAIRARSTPPGQLDRPATSVFRADGYRLWDPYRHAGQHRRLASETARYEALIYRSGEFRTLARSSQHYLERLVALAVAHGDKPTFVIMPVHPWSQARLAPYGWYAHRDQVRAWLDGFVTARRAQVVDYSDVHSFGGSAVDFHDNVHLTEPNALRVVAALQRAGLFANPSA